MTTTVEATIAFGDQPVGQVGPVVTPNLPSDCVAYQVNFTNDSTWPTNGQDVLEATTEVSWDGGSTWTLDAQVVLSGQGWVDRHGNPINTSGWNVGWDDSGTTQAQLRLTLNMLQECNFGAALSIIEP